MNIDKEYLEQLAEIAEMDDDDSASQIDLAGYARKLIDGWKTILLFALITAAVGVGIGFSLPREYTSVTTVAPEITTRTSSGGLTSLASLAGININNMAVTDAMHPDMYPAIVKSTSFIIDLFDMPVDLQTKKEGLVHTDLYDYMINYTKSPWWGAVLGLPMMAKDMLVNLFKSEPEELPGHAEIDSLRLTREQERVVKALLHSITVNVEKKTYILSVKVTMQDRTVAANLANRIISQLERFVIDYRTEKARLNVDYYRQQEDEARAEYLKAQRAYAYYLDSHQEINWKSTLVERERLQNEAQLRFQMYNSVAQNLMQAEAKVQLETPVLVPIQRALAPNIGKPSKFKLMVLYFFLGLCLGAFWILWGKSAVSSLRHVD